METASSKYSFICLLLFRLYVLNDISHNTMKSPFFSAYFSELVKLEKIGAEDALRQLMTHTNSLAAWLTRAIYHKVIHMRL